MLKNWFKFHHPCVIHLMTYLQLTFFFSYWEKVHWDIIACIKWSAGGCRWFMQNAGESGWEFSMWVKLQKCRSDLLNAGDLSYLFSFACNYWNSPDNSLLTNCKDSSYKVIILKKCLCRILTNEATQWYLAVSWCKGWKIVQKRKPQTLFPTVNHI